MRTNFNDFEFRCSALGKIVSKSGKLTDGVKTYLNDVFIGEIYNTRKEAFGKALEKGVFCEEDGITMIGNTLLKGELVMKNKERKSNGYIHGECDVFKNNTVYDVKNALDLFTFGKADLTWDYDWQLVGYAWLWNVDKAFLFYCLNNMPEHMIELEKRKLYYTKAFMYAGIDDPKYLKDCEILENAHNYDNMPLVEKFKFWEIELSEKRIEQLKSAIEVARIYLNELLENYLNNIEKNSKILTK